MSSSHSNRPQPVGLLIDGDNVVGRLELPRDSEGFIADFEKKYAKLRLRVGVMHVHGSSNGETSTTTDE